MEEDISHEILHFVDRMPWSSLLKSSAWLGGRHESLKKGRSPEFKEYREHRLGEDASLVDWKGSAKGVRRLVRECDHQGLLNHWLILDDSASMSFPDGEFEKFRRQQILCGLLLYWIQSIGDCSSVIRRSADRTKTSSPSRGQAALRQKIAQIALGRTGSRFHFDDLRSELRVHLQQPSVIWMMTDFDRSPEECIELGGRWREEGHEVHILHLYHPTERDLGMRGLTVFEDLEGQWNERSTDVAEIKEGFIEEMESHLQKIQYLARATQVRIHSVNVCLSPEAWMAKVLSPVAN